MPVIYFFGLKNCIFVFGYVIFLFLFIVEDPREINNFININKYAYVC